MVLAMKEIKMEHLMMENSLMTNTKVLEPIGMLMEAFMRGIGVIL